MLLLLFFPLVSNVFHILFHSIRNIFGKISAHQLSIWLLWSQWFWVHILLALAFRHLEPCCSQFLPQGFFSDYFYTCVCLLQCHCPKWNLVLFQSTISVSFVYVSMIFVRHGLSSPYKIMPSLAIILISLCTEKEI